MEESKLKDKPEPDIFQVATDRMGVTYDRTIVVDQCLSGV